MRITIALVLAAVAFSVAVASAYLARPSRDDRLTVPVAVQDLGSLPQGATAHCTFKLENNTSDDIQLLTVNKTCNCLSAELDQPVLRPGESGQLTVDFRSGAARGLTQARLTLIYLVGYNGRRAVKLTLKANILADINYSPSELTFEKGGPYVRVVEFTPGESAEFKIHNIHCSHPAFAASLTPGTRLLSIAFDTSKWQQSEGVAELLVETSSINQPLVRIPLRVSKSSFSKE